MMTPNFTLQEAATQRILSQMPYAQFIGMEVGVDETQSWLFKLAFSEQNIGNNIVPALHGGLIEDAIWTHFILRLRCGARTLRVSKLAV